MEAITRNNLNVKELMTYLNISQATAYRLIHAEGFYPAFKIGNKVLINKDKLERWIFDQSMKGASLNE